MAGIEWRAPAVADLTAIVEYIAEDNPAAAFELAEEIDARVSALAEQPRLGRPGRVEGTRELVVHPSYIVVYRLSREGLTVLRVLHAARRWP